MKQAIYICPYKTFSKMDCTHINAEKIDGVRKTICRYKNNPEKCQLFKDWKNKIDKLIDGGDKQK